MDTVADYFYCSRNGEKSRGPKWMLQALLYQILAQNPKLYEHFREGFHEVRSTKHILDYSTLKKTFLALCVYVHQQRVFVSPRFYLVIDAFDESENDESVDRTDFFRYDILSMLSGPHRFKASLHLEDSSSQLSSKRHREQASHIQFN